MKDLCQTLHSGEGICTSQPVRRSGQVCENPAMGQTLRGAFSFQEKLSRTRLCILREAMDTQLTISWTKNFSERKADFCFL